eukprot:scaffold538_cov412-Prasinococcus_capsulatus_cf.AAC.11
MKIKVQPTTTATTTTDGPMAVHALAACGGGLRTPGPAAAGGAVHDTRDVAGELTRGTSTAALLRQRVRAPGGWSPAPAASAASAAGMLCRGWCRGQHCAPPASPIWRVRVLGESSFKLADLRRPRHCAAAAAKTSTTVSLPQMSDTQAPSEDPVDTSAECTGAESSDNQLELHVKWNSQSFTVRLDSDVTVAELKDQIYEKTGCSPFGPGVLAKRQKLLNVRHQGKPAGDDVRVRDCVKPGSKVMVLGTVEKELQETEAVAAVQEAMSTVVDDLDIADADLFSKEGTARRARYPLR